MSKRNTLVGPQLKRGRTDFNPDWKRLIAFVAVIVLVFPALGKLEFSRKV
jgi:hypothetical protein